MFAAFSGAFVHRGTAKLVNDMRQLKCGGASTTNCSYELIHHIVKEVAVAVVENSLPLEPGSGHYYTSVGHGRLSGHENDCAMPYTSLQLIC